jgi:hypothetical protein
METLQSIVVFLLVVVVAVMAVKLKKCCDKG